jgi:hypothetical protein
MLRRVFLMFLLSAPFVYQTDVLASEGKIEGSGVLVTEVRDVQIGSELEVSGAVTVDWVRGSPASLVVEAEDNLLSHVHTVRAGNVLKVFSGSNIKPTKPLAIRIHAPTLTKVMLGGAVKVAIRDLQTDHFSARVDGASALDLYDVQSSRWSVNASGASEIHVREPAKTPLLQANIEVSGASNVDMKSIGARDVTVHTSGTSRAFVYPLEKLMADARGVSRISYRGEPTTVTPNTAGLGRISRMTPLRRQ